MIYSPTISICFQVKTCAEMAFKIRQLDFRSSMIYCPIFGQITYINKISLESDLDNPIKFLKSASIKNIKKGVLKDLELWYSTFNCH